MATSIYCTGYEHGLATIVTSGGGLADTVQGTVEVQSTVKKSGSYALKCTANSTTNARYVKNVTSTRYLVGSLQIRLETAAAYGFFAFQNGIWVEAMLEADGDIHWYTSGYTGASSNVKVTAGEFFRIDFLADGISSTIDWKINGTAQTQYSWGTSANFTSLRIGIASGGDWIGYYDDVSISATSGDYPIGESSGTGLRPDADGTNVPGTNTMEYVDGTDVSGGSPAYAMLDDNPWTSSNNTDLIQQNTANTSAYCEVGFANTTYANINGVMAVLQYAASIANADEGACYILHANDTIAATVWGNNATRADYSETTPFYKSAIVTPPGGGWTTAAVNGLKARIGHSNDVVDKPYWLALMLEVDGNGTASSFDANNYVRMRWTK